MKKIAVLILILTILANMVSFGKATKKINSDAQLVHSVIIIDIIIKILNIFFIIYLSNLLF